MDLALVTGRGNPLGTEWPGVERPLIVDADVIQLGERESRDADFAWPDVKDTAIDRIDVFEATADRSGRRCRAYLRHAGRQAGSRFLGSSRRGRIGPSHHAGGRLPWQSRYTARGPSSDPTA